MTDAPTTTGAPRAPEAVHPYGGVDPRYSPEELAELLDGDGRRPTPQQSAVISAPLTPRLVVAGAGSGKTATMVDRVVWLVANGIVAPDQVLGVTFTRKAAGELGERMRHRLATLRAAGVEVPAAEGEDDVPQAPQDPTVSTYHSYANALVRDYGLRIGIEPDTTLLGPAQAWQLAAQTVEDWTGELLEAMPAKSTMVRAVLGLASACAEHLVAPEAVERFAEQLLGELATTPPGRRKRSLGPTLKKVEHTQRASWVLAELVAEFTRRKREAQAMDFGDLLSAAARLAAEDPTARDTERQRHRVVLLDEFQDTSHAQLRLFSALFGHGHSVMAVGDPQQSIYGFRGASAGQLFGFYDSFPVAPGEDGRPSFLTTAWRNDARILDVANTLAAPLRSLPPWARGASPLTVPELDPRPGAGPGEVRLSRYATDVEEAVAIAEQVRARRAEHRGDPAEMPTMAVLCRKRSQIEPVRRELAARGLPYEVVGLGGLLATPEVGDVVATLRVLDDPGRSDALVRLLGGARWRIGTRDLMALSDWAAHLERRRTEAAEAGRPEDLESPVTEEEAQEDALVEPDLSDHASLIEALETLPRPGWASAHGRSLSDAARARMLRLRDELDHLRPFLADDLPSLLHEVETVMGLDVEVAAHPHRSSHQARRNLDAFHEAALTFTASSATGDVSAFLAWLDVTLAEENGLEPGPDRPRQDAVQLVTVHSSKGLEWDHVYVPGLNTKNFPTDNPSRWTVETGALPWPLRGDARFLPQWSVDTTDLKALEDSHTDYLELAAQHAEDEERRLAYVAVTRARSVLELSCTVFRGTARTGQEPSVFVAELAPLTQGPAPSVRRGPWAEVPPGTQNPAAATVLSAPWPYDPLEGPEITETVTAEDGTSSVRVSPPPHRGRRDALEGAARAVLARGFPDTAGLDVEDLLGAAERDGLAPDPRRWSEEARILLARHEDARSERTVPMPSHVSASTLVALSRDPHDVVSGLRRPMPRRPGTAARRGTTFHAWVEQFYGSSAIFDVGELPGSADEYVDEAYDLPGLSATFRASPWADRQPYAVEFPLETPIGGITVRGRVDAVFRNGDGTWELVDWKTGRAPAGRELQERSAQLAVYRLAWSRLRGAPLEDVTAAFYYVAEDRVVRPHDLAGTEELEAVVREAYRVVLRA